MNGTDSRRVSASAVDTGKCGLQETDDLIFGEVDKKQGHLRY